MEYYLVTIDYALTEIDVRNTQIRMVKASNKVSAKEAVKQELFSDETQVQIYELYVHDTIIGG
tara:strand:+ start:1708 stop:1896 length:189 start_codon:yes stop_codon:yes gene_type:complete